MKVITDVKLEAMKGGGYVLVVTSIPVYLEGLGTQQIVVCGPEETESRVIQETPSSIFSALGRD